MMLTRTTNPSGKIRGQVLRDPRRLSVLLAPRPAALAAKTFTAVPNPFQEALSVNFEARSSGTGTLRVSDLPGRTVATQTLNVRTGANQAQVRVPGAAGVYLLVVELDDSRIVSRVTKQ